MQIGLKMDYYPGSGKIAIFTLTYENYDNYEVYDTHANLGLFHFTQNIENNNNIVS